MGRNSTAVVVGAAVVVGCTAAAAAAVVVTRWRAEAERRREALAAAVGAIDALFARPTGELRLVADAMVGEMVAGLADEEKSSIKMLHSYVDNLPTGVQKSQDTYGLKIEVKTEVWKTVVI